MEEPEVSIVVPVYESVQFIALTCDSLLALKDVRWEALFIYGKFGHEIIDLIESYQDPRMHLQTMAEGSFFTLMNRGLMMARAPYITFLLEGCSYLSGTSLTTAMKQIHERNDPDLFYTASYIGDEKGNMHLYYQAEPFSALENGLQPTFLQSCFFKTELLKKIGYFRQDFERRGALDLFCRLAIDKNISISSEERVYVEMHLFPRHLQSPWLVFKETWQVLLHHFGRYAALKWLFSKKCRAIFTGNVLESVVEKIG